MESINQKGIERDKQVEIKFEEKTEQEKARAYSNTFNPLFNYNKKLPVLPAAHEEI